MGKTTKTKVKASDPVAVERKMYDPLKLLLDPHNPRLTEIGAKISEQDKLIKAVWDYGVLEIVTSIAASGFHNVEPLFAELQPDGRYLVIEGNRRLCALQVLLDQERAQRLGITGLPALRPEIRATCQEIPIAIGKREDVWAFIGTKHLNGPKTWDSEGKANYIKYVHETLGISLPMIAETIGDRSRTVIRMYESTKAFEQAVEWKAYNFSDSNRSGGDIPFSHLYTLLGYDAARTYLGMKEAGSKDAIDVIRTPVASAKKKELGEVLRWLYGHKGEEVAPLIRTQNPDLRHLAKALSTKRSVAALRAGSGVESAADVAEDDDKYVEAHLIMAREELELSNKKFATGYTGQPHLAKLIEEIREIVRGLLAQKVLKENKDDL